MAKRHHSNRVSNLVRRSVACSAAALAMSAGAIPTFAQNAPGAPSLPGSTRGRGAGSVTPSQGFPAAQPGAADSSSGGGGGAAGGMVLPGDPGTTHPGTSADTAKVKVDDNLVVDLHVNDEDLANVLQMLSIQSQRNIVASNNVNAKVKADLYGVTFYEALDAILHVNGYGYVDKGNFIYVYTLEELQQIEKASRVRVSKMINLNYLNAIDAAEFVKPLLSDGGQIKTNGKTKDFPNVGTTPVGNEEFANNATLVVYDYQNHVDEIEKLVKQLDTRPSQVLVEATILQTQLTEDNAWGVDFSMIADMNFTDFVGAGNGPLKAVDSMITNPSTPVAGLADDNGRGLVSTPGNTAGPGTLKLGLIANDVAVFVKMLDQVTDTTILSNPKVMALNRQPSRVLVGRKVGYLNTTSNDTTTTQSVEFLDTGTQLYFRPFVSTDGMIRMELKPQVSEAIIRDTKDSSGASVTIPDEDTSEVVTNVLVRDGQTIVLGGLFRESTTSGRRQIPFLGDIPIIGAAFRGQEDTTKRDEIIFLITPTIVNDQSLASGGQNGKDYVERARVGAREGILPWSRDRMTGAKLVQANKLAAEGKTQEALWKVEQSMSLNPNQPEAIAMREKFGGERPQWPNRSMLESIMAREAKAKTAQAEGDAPAGDTENLNETFSPADDSGMAPETPAAPAAPSAPKAQAPAPEAPAPAPAPKQAKPAKAKPAPVPPPADDAADDQSDGSDAAAPAPSPDQGPFFESGPAKAPAKAKAKSAKPVEPAPEANPNDSSENSEVEDLPGTGKEIAPAYSTQPLKPTAPPTDSPKAKPAQPKDQSNPKGASAGTNDATRAMVAQLARFVSWCQSVFAETPARDSKSTLSFAQRQD